MFSPKTVCSDVFGTDVNTTSSVVLFIDVSGSVSFRQYWNKVNDIYTDLLEQKKHITIYVWDHLIRKINHNELLIMIKRQSGYGGTDPRVIANMLKTTKTFNNIIIITDGEISDDLVRKTDLILQDVSLNYVTCYIISNTRNTSSINLSVVCPFVRGGTSKVLTIGIDLNTFVCQQQRHATDFGILDRISSMTIDDFLENYSLIESLLIARNMGRSTGDLSIKDQLLAFQKKMNHLSSVAHSSKNYGIDMRQALKNVVGGVGGAGGAGDSSVITGAVQALNIARLMSSDYYGMNNGNDIEKKVSYLMSLCGDLSGQYNVQAIRSSRLFTAPKALPVTKPDIPDVLTDYTTKPYTCPITDDDDICSVLFLVGTPILTGLSKNTVDDIINNPLNLLNYPDVVSALLSRIGHSVGSSFSGRVDTDPFTRREIIGTLPLGSNQQHVDVGNYTLARLMTGSGKMLGNIHMYYAVIWFLIYKNKIPFLDDIKDQVTEHLVYRLTNSITNASMCGLGSHVITKIPTDVAIWYVLNSCLLVNSSKADTMRMHIFSSSYMLDIIDVLGYPMHDGAVKQITRTKVMMSMLSLVKKNGPQFYNMIRCLVQKGQKVDLSTVNPLVLKNETNVNWIPLDGPASADQIALILSSFPDYYSSLSIHDLVGIASMVSPSKSVSDITLPVSCSWTATNVPQINWTNFGVKNYPIDVVPICPSTFRPFTHVIHPSTSTSTSTPTRWQTVAQTMYGSSTGWFSTNRRFLDFFIKYSFFPNKDEFLLFCFTRQHNLYGDICTLPFMVSQWIDEMLMSYHPIQQLIIDNGITSSQVMKILNKSTHYSNRELMETMTIDDVLKML
jgi:hypothetical protein